MVSNITAARWAVYIGRFFLVCAFLALLSASVSQLTKSPVFGMSQEHIFHDATVLALLGIGMFLDAIWHARNL